MDYWREIIKIVGYDLFYKGRMYPYRYIGSPRIEKNNNNYTHNYSVKSERNNNRYEVKIINNGPKIFGINCNCSQFAKERTCKHLSAVLIQNLDR